MVRPPGEESIDATRRPEQRARRQAPEWLSRPPPELQADDLIAEVLAQAEPELPVLPRVAQRLLAVCQDADSSVSEIATLLRHDPALAGHVLRVANSPFFAPRTPIVSLTQALTRLGLGHIREIALMVAMRGTAYRARGLEGLLDELYRRAVLSAFFAQEIARLRRLNVEEAFLGGLLHDIGEPVVMRIAIASAERRGVPIAPRTLGRVVRQTHGELGARIVSAWSLPEAFVEAARGHHDPHPERPLVQLTRLADDLADYASEGCDEPDLFIGHPMAESLNLYPDDVSSLVARGPELVAAAEGV